MLSIVLDINCYYSIIFIQIYDCPILLISYILVQDANIHLLTLILKFLFSTDFIIKSYHKER